MALGSRLDSPDPPLAKSQPESRKQVPRSVVTYGAIISACERSGQWQAWSGFSFVVVTAVLILMIVAIIVLFTVFS